MNPEKQDIRQFLDLLGSLWESNPQLTFGSLVVQVFMGLNNQFSTLSFTNQNFETWVLSLESIMETNNVPIEQTGDDSSSEETV